MLIIATLGQMANQTTITTVENILTSVTKDQVAKMFFLFFVTVCVCVCVRWQAHTNLTKHAFMSCFIFAYNC